ncbi:MAG: ATP-binding cassette domain-containing protein [Erysipelotrichaceae bacterium]|nr:ATP-binding cassette domain-containing protein [Erysipelotrichaceae bacterium]
MLKLNHIQIGFENNIVFDDAFFEANSGELTVLCGKSGTVKSTLIDTLLCKHPCEYQYNNNMIDIQNSDDYIYNNISIVYQQPCFFDELTIEEHIHFIMELYGIDDNQESLLDILKIRDLLHKFPRQLSGGEQTSCSLFLSILKQPSILILDEPTAALDKDNKDSVIDLIKQYAHRGHIVIASSHDLSLIQQADVLYTIENKKLIKDIKHENSITNNVLSYHKNNQIFLKYIRKSLIHQKLYKSFCIFY